MTVLEQLTPHTSSPPFTWWTAPWQRLKEEARRLKTNLTALWYASSDARVPLTAKVVATLVLALVLSPIDIIPDFIPVLGVLDELILAPFGIWLAIRLIPKEAWKDAQRQAEESSGKKLPVNYYTATIIIVFWLAAALWGAMIMWAIWHKQHADELIAPQSQE